ncbi:ABC transporter ATP-binding protein [Virgisporangium aurantiacum]|uniref:ABC transporter ATP-binding protein n=1 Tax=Virgisporangium aurantiacum TaxID=175570 RepID=A0A8J4DZU2_9ACTN|nr:ABC transporter ATP-binding protein [Virgisporangium aurantiacum]GIJ56304.1 ABC transporter ATP-binding protein [Virgisporangium aurantiacum]
MLEVSGLDAYYGDARALSEVSLTVHDGETVAVIGPNGAGKSTLVNAIAGLHPHRSGRIAVGGTDITGVPAHRVCEHGVAVVPEGRRVFATMSVYDNLCLGAYRRTARAGHKQRLDRVFDVFPRLRQRVTQPAGTLSGGEQQMLAIGRALMAGPTLLLLDEPSLGLAPVLTDEVFEALGAVGAQGVSVLLVEQDIDRALDLATRTYLLAEGRVAGEGPSADLRGSDEVRRSVLGL